MFAIIADVAVVHRSAGAAVAIVLVIVTAKIFIRKIIWKHIFLPGDLSFSPIFVRLYALVLFFSVSLEKNISLSNIV